MDESASTVLEKNSPCINTRIDTRKIIIYIIYTMYDDIIIIDTRTKQRARRCSARTPM